MAVAPDGNQGKDEGAGAETAEVLILIFVSTSVCLDHSPFGCRSRVSVFLLKKLAVATEDFQAKTCHVSEPSS